MVQVLVVYSVSATHGRKVMLYGFGPQMAGCINLNMRQESETRTFVSLYYYLPQTGELGY